jgi:DNA-binding NarL/FixJ family response regulator
MSTRLVLADEHPIVLDGMENLFLLEKDFKILARCTTGEEALCAVRSYRPNILVLDVRLPVKSGFDVLREIATHKIPTRSVIFTAALNEDEMLEAIRLGASGIVLKEMAPKLLIRCIKKVQVGGKWFERESSARALQKLTERESTMRLGYEVLSFRQLQVVRMIAGGLRNKDIAKKLFISEGTVQIHLHNIYDKLDLKSRLALALYARDRGIV